MAKNVFGATIPTNVSLKANAPVSTPQKSVIIKNNTPKPSSGGSSKKTTPSLIDSYVTAQKNAGLRVLNVLNPFSNAPIPLVNPISGNILNDDVGWAVRSVVRVAEAGSLAYGVSLIPAAGAGFARTSVGATSMLPASLDATKPLLFGLGGLLGGFGLASFGKPAPMTQDTSAGQTVNTYQTTDSRQFTDAQQYSYVNQNFKIKDSPGASLYGTAIPSQTVSPALSVSPIQDVAPSQDVSPNQAQNTGTNWGLIALIGAGAYLFLRNN
jgi:hypothetical protein